MSYFEVMPSSNTRFLIPLIISSQLLKLSVAFSPDLSQLYVGCYRDVRGDEDLPFEKHNREVYTSIESCTGYCFRKGFKYVGLQAEQWCLCGNTYGKHGKVVESDCSSTCRGDSAQKCGGPWRNSVYHAVSPEDFVGCYKGGESHETSDDAINLVEGLTNSSLACIHACQSKRKGYRYAAVQYGTRLCSCGYSLAKYGQATSFTECVNGMPERNVIHKISGVANLLIGCFVDAPSRDLSITIANDKVTPLKCIKECGQRGYRFAGMQAGHECHCGNSYGSHGEGKAADCSFECGGSGEIDCGGLWRNSIYRVDSEPTSLLGCFKDAMETDQTPRLSGSDTSATVCKSACASNGFPYAAVHNSSSCKCGLSYESYQQSENRQCNELCSGKSICGVAGRASIYSTGVKPKTPTEYKMFSSSNKNKILIGHVIYSERHLPDAHLCIKYCMISDDCQSINYNSVTKVCQLNNATLTLDKESAVISGSWYYQAARVSHSSMMTEP